MKKTIFRGSGVALVTPFDESGVNIGKLRELIEFHISNKTDAIIICGTTGESSTMSEFERSSAVKCAVDVVAGRIPVIAGTGSNDTEKALKFTKYAESVGVDAVLLVTPYYNKSTQNGLVRHFGYISDAVNVPMILYEVPSRTGVRIDIETYVELAKLSNIVGVKDATGDVAHTAKIAAACRELDIYSGNDDCIIPVLSLGGKGVISVLANIAPLQVHEMCENYFNGNLQASLESQLKFLKLIDALFIETNPIPVKSALNLLGFGVGNLRLPLCDMNERNLEKLRSSLNILQ